MNKVLLGSTQILVSEMAFGTLVISPLQANIPARESQFLLEYAFDQGVNFFDTAHLYQTYSFFTHIPSHKKNQMVLSSKSYQPDYKGMMEEIDYGLQQIQREYFDIFMLHEQESIYTLKGHREALRAVMDAKKQGKVRAVGISTHSVQLTKQLLLHPEFEVVHPIFNQVGHGLIHGNLEDQKENIKQLYEAGKGLFVMKPLGGGRLYKDFYPSITWVRDFPYKHSVAIGVKNKQELDVDIAIFENTYKEDMKEKLHLEEKKLFYNRSLCSLCLACTKTCQFNALQYNEKKNCIEIHYDQCVTCGYCVAHCPSLALRIL
ncbi:MAG: aldo/keto reductase [Caldisericia bacterium]|nr:aldo/keto reductase [Caldisericia bacterium]